tara:strand:- start:245 stop:763 length:519 start_codon:yes stop_codon:yes gene_type:complete
MTEIWKEIDGWSNYKVSTFGRVMSFAKYRDGKLLSTKSPKDGYKMVSIRKNNKRKQFSVHRLVALTFLPNYYNLPEVDHKDRNRQNNSIYNLRWITHKENMKNTSIYRYDIEEQDLKKRKLIRVRQLQQKKKDAKRFYCNTCNYAFISNYALEKHYKTKIHITKLSISPTNY